MLQNLFLYPRHKLEGQNFKDENVNWQKMIVNLNDYKLFQEQYEKETFEKT